MRALLALLLFPACGWVFAQESKTMLQAGAGAEKVQQCITCHSLDYIEMNSHFMDKAAWTATVNKMINVYGAPIPKDDVEPITTYLARFYGKPDEKKSTRP